MQTDMVSPVLINFVHIMQTVHKEGLYFVVRVIHYTGVLIKQLPVLNYYCVHSFLTMLSVPQIIYTVK